MTDAKILRPKIQIGFRAGGLTVEAPTAERKSGYTVWLCRCDCGGEIRLDTRCLQRGTVTDCGCKTKVKPGQRDLTGQRFGRLVCLEPTEKRNLGGNVIWRCQCDCGNLCLAVGAQLIQGYKKSCGCLGHPPLKDYMGKRFGMLTVLEYAGKADGMHRWRCLCDCGQETVVGQTLLQTGKTKSCGCLQKRVYEKNLRLVDGTSVTILEAYRKRTVSSNSSGYKGVYWDRSSGKWSAQITFKRKQYHLGQYDRLSDAIKARQCGEKMHNDFLDWYYKTYPVKEICPPGENR